MNSLEKSNYDALLKEAIVQWRIKENVLSRLAEVRYYHLVNGGHAGDATDSLIVSEQQRVQQDYHSWIDRNLTAHDIRCEIRNTDSKPLRLVVVVAG